jgi:hypothetical protein
MIKALNWQLLAELLPLLYVKIDLFLFEFLNI